MPIPAYRLQAERAAPPARAALAGAAPVDADILQLIRDWKWFAYVPPQAQQWLAQRAVIRRIAKGREVFVDGAPATHTYAVLSGAFRIYITSSNGTEVTLEEVARGGWFPHVPRRSRPLYAGNCVCQSEAVVAAFSQAVMAEFAQRWPAFYEGLYYELGDRAVLTLGRIELLSLHNLTVRLAVYLLRLARLRGRREAAGSIWVAADQNQAEIGTRVGGTRQRINVVLKALARNGIIELHKDGTRILDLPRLTAEATASGFDVDTYLAGLHPDWGGEQAQALSRT
jgi:CRP/FNR family transcriptional regulator, cyclic AMP receptor protein